MEQLLTIAAMTARDALRRPIVLLLTVTAVLLTGLAPMVLLHTFGEPGKLARDGGLAFHFLFGMLVVVQASASALSREIRAGTAATVLSKPVGRDMYFLAKYAGVALVVLAFSLAAMMSTLLAECVAERWTQTPRGAGELVDWRTGRWLLLAPLAALAVAGVRHYASRRPFGSAAFGLLLVALGVVLMSTAVFDRTGALAAFAWRLDWRLLPAGALMTAALLVLAAVAVTASTRLSAGATSACCLLLLVMGMLWEYILGPPPAGGLALWLYGLVPNWQHFWMSDALIGGGRIPWAYVGDVYLYGGFYTAALLILGMVSFRHADV